MINGFDNSTIIFVLTITVLESMLCAEVHLFLRINHRKALHTNILFGLCNKNVCSGTADQSISVGVSFY